MMCAVFLETLYCICSWVTMKSRKSNYSLCSLLQTLDPRQVKELEVIRQSLAKDTLCNNKELSQIHAHICTCTHIAICSHESHPPSYIQTSTIIILSVCSHASQFVLNHLIQWGHQSSTMKLAQLIGGSVLPAYLYIGLSVWCSHWPTVCLFLFSLVDCIMAHFPDNQVTPGKYYCTLHFRISWMKEMRFLFIVSFAFCSQHFNLAVPLNNCL